MADGVITNGAEQIASNYEKYKDNFADDSTSKLGQTDFLTLMIEQLKNQDLNNPQSDTEFIAQMAQFSALEAQQENLTYAQGNYAASLLGRAVNIGSVSGDNVSVSDTGLVTGVFKNGDEYNVIVNGNQYKLSQVISVQEAYPVTDTDETDKKDDVAEDNTTDAVEETPSGETATSEFEEA